MSDVKGWNPEYQSILETFDMINNKYENPDVSKDLNIQWLNGWNDTTESLDTYASSFTWNTPLNPDYANTSAFNFEIYSKIYNYINLNNISNFLHIYNNEKKDRMLEIFQIPKMSNYNETEKPKRMEIGYYCKDKKEFKTLFNNQSFTNGKHVENKNDIYYIIHKGYLSDAIKLTTFGQLLIYLQNNQRYDSTTFAQVLIFRYYKTINNYLSNINSSYSMRFIPSFNNDYSGGGY